MTNYTDEQYYSQLEAAIKNGDADWSPSMKYEMEKELAEYKRRIESKK